MSDIKSFFKSRFVGGNLIEADYCLAPGTKVLTHDFQHAPIETLEVGQKLVGFEETLRKYGGTTFQPATIVGKKSLHKPCIKLTFSDGTSVTGSKDHMWVAQPEHKKVAAWYRMDEIKPGFRFSQVCELWEDKRDDPAYAWMGGFLDGEGWISHGATFGVGQNVDEAHQPVWDRFLPQLQKDFSEVGLSKNKHNKVTQARPYGLRTSWTAVGLYQPVRLLRTLQSTYPGTIVRSKRIKVRTVVAMEDVGEQEVIAIETDTHTFIAEGMLSHNCQLEVVGLAFLSRDRQLRTDIIDKVDIHSVNAANLIGMAVPKFLDLKKLKDPYALNQRNLAKRLSFQLQYGAGANSMAKQNKIGVDVAKRFIDNYYERYPGVRKWQEDVAQQVADARVVHPSLHTEAGYPVGESVFSSVTGRRYYFREYDNPYYGKDKKWGKPPTNFSPTQLKNYPVQGFATGDIVPMMLGKMYRRIAGNPNLLLINTVHDSMVFDSNHREMDTIDACRLIRQELSLTPQYIREEFGLPFDLPLEVEIKAGKMWADMDVIPLD